MTTLFQHLAIHLSRCGSCSVLLEFRFQTATHRPAVVRGLLFGVYLSAAFALALPANAQGMDVKRQELSEPLPFTQKELIDKFFAVMDAEGGHGFFNSVEKIFDVNLVIIRTEDKFRLYANSSRPGAFSQYEVTVTLNDVISYDNDYRYFTFAWKFNNDLPPLQNLRPPMCVETRVILNRLKNTGWFLTDTDSGGGRDGVPARPNIRYHLLDSRSLTEAKREIVIFSDDPEIKCLSYIAISPPLRPPAVSLR